MDRGVVDREGVSGSDGADRPRAKIRLPRWPSRRQAAAARMRASRPLSDGA